MSCSTSSISSASFTMSSSAATATAACTATQSASLSKEQQAIATIQQRIHDDKGGVNTLTSDLLAVRDTITTLDLSQCPLDLKKLQTICLLFKNITDLNLSGCGLAGEEFASWHKALKNVRMLNLSNNKITEAGLQHIAKLSQLREVILTGNTLTESDRLAFTQRTGIRILYEESPPPQQTIDALQSRLREVSGNYSTLTSSEQTLLSTAGQYIVDLDLSYCKHIDERQLALTLQQLPKLKTLNLHGSSISSIPPLPATLETLDLGYCWELQDLPRDAFAQCTHLQTVNLELCFHLSQINCILPASVKTFNLRICDRLASIGDQVFSQCDNLTLLDLQQSVLKQFNFILPAGLKTFKISYCEQLTTIGKTVFSRCSSLETINLEGCDALTTFNCTLPASLKKLILTKCTALTQLPCALPTGVQIDYRHCPITLSEQQTAASVETALAANPYTEGEEKELLETARRKRALAANNEPNTDTPSSRYDWILRGLRSRLARRL